MTSSTAVAVRREDARTNAGQFGEQYRDEADFDAPSPAAMFEDDLATKSAIVMGIAHSAAQRSARARSEKAVIEWDDLAQDVVASYVTLRRGGKTVEDLQAWTRRAVFMHLGKSGQISSGETRKAMLALKEWRAEFLDINGRRPTPAQVAEWGENYSQSCQPRRRPWKQFWLMPEKAIENHYIDPDALMQLAGNNPTAEPAPTVAVDSYMEIATTLSGRNKVHGKKFVAVALMEQNEAPLPRKSSVTVNQVKAWRKTMRDYPGGVEAALQAHNNGFEDAGTKALFGPWEAHRNPDKVKELHIDDRDQVCEVFGKYRSMAPDLWNSAVTFADQTNEHAINACALDAAKPDKPDKGDRIGAGSADAARSAA